MPQVDWKVFDFKFTAINPQRNEIVAIDSQFLYVWDISSGEKKKLAIPTDKGITAVTISPDGHFLLLGDENGTVTIYHLEFLKMLITLKAHRSALNFMQFSFDGKYLVTSGTQPSKVKVWRVRKNQDLIIIDPMKGKKKIPSTRRFCAEHYSLS